MPYGTISEAPANIRKLDGASLTLAQVNWIARVADGLDPDEVENVWAVAIAQFKRSYVKRGDRWVKRQLGCAGGSPYGELGDQGLPDLTRTLEQWFSPERARRIAVTEATRVYALGNREAWRNSYTDPYLRQATGIRARRWQTARDDLVCPICRPLQGKQALLDEDFPVPYGDPPAHPNCRCHTTPIKDYNPRMAP